MVAKHEQERLAINGLTSAVDGMTQPFLTRLDDEGNAAAHIEQTAGVVLKMTRQFVEIFDGDLKIEKVTEGVEVAFLYDDNDFFDTGFERFFDDEQYGGFGDAVTINDGKQFFFGGFAGGEEACAKTGSRDDRFANFRPGAESQPEGGQVQVTFQNFDNGLLVGGAAGDELGGAISLRTHALAPPDMRLERLIVEDAIENRRGQFLWAGGGSIPVEK